MPDGDVLARAAVIAGRSCTGLQQVADAGCGRLSCGRKGAVSARAEDQAYKLERAMTPWKPNQKLGYGMDLREYGLARKSLLISPKDHPPVLRTIPRTWSASPGYGLKVVEQVPIRVKPNPHNAKYLRPSSRRWVTCSDGQSGLKSKTSGGSFTETPAR